MSANVFRICVRAIPVGELSLLSYLCLAFYKFTFSQDISPCVFNSRFVFLLWGNVSMIDTGWSKSDISMQIHIKLSVNLSIHSFRQLIKFLFLCFTLSFQLQIFFSLNIFEVFESISISRLIELFVELFSGLHCLGDFFRKFVKIHSVLGIFIYDVLS